MLKVVALRVSLHSCLGRERPTKRLKSRSNVRSTVFPRITKHWLRLKTTSTLNSTSARRDTHWLPWCCWSTTAIWRMLGWDWCPTRSTKRSFGATISIRLNVIRPNLVSHPCSETESIMTREDCLSSRKKKLRKLQKELTKKAKTSRSMRRKWKASTKPMPPRTLSPRSSCKTFEVDRRVKTETNFKNCYILFI